MPNLPKTIGDIIKEKIDLSTKEAEAMSPFISSKDYKSWFLETFKEDLRAIEMSVRK